LPHPVFSEPEDYALIEELLPPILRRTGAQLLGYCWMPDAIHLALQIDEEPLGSFMRQLTSDYAQNVHRRSGARGQFFRRRYQSTLVDSEKYLPSLIHYLHYIPVLARIAPDPDEYPYSSHSAYLGVERGLTVYTKPLWQFIGSSDREAYRRLTAEAPPASLGATFERGNPRTPGFVGDPTFLASLSRRGRPARSTRSLDEISEQVAQAHGVHHAQIFSSSRRKELVLARARIAWFATERRIANLGGVARYLNRSASSLTRAIARHQFLQPESFTLSAFAQLAPLLPLRSGEHQQIRRGNGEALSGNEGP
jgi:REP element-mobilizing transposase RayT